jgi:DNA mismatch repair protein MutS
MASRKKPSEPSPGPAANDAAPSPAETPLMRQYQAAKARYPRHLLFFHLGDFYELFFEDAKTAARVLGLTLTSRSKGPEAIPMAGVPVHMAETYLARLLRMGYSVAVCDQTEDPALAKGLVKREVTRVVTPGTVVEENLLDAKKPNRLVALWPEKGAAARSETAERDETSYGLASVDLAEGTLYLQELTGAQELAAELARLAPSECVLPEPDRVPPGARSVSLLPASARGKFALSYVKPAAFEPREAHARLLARFGGSDFSRSGSGSGDFSRSSAADLKKLLQELPRGAGAAGALLGYLEEMHAGAAQHLQAPRRMDLQAHLLLDETAIRSLELVETLRNRSYEGSLLWTLDRTCTGAGARALREWLLRPLRELEPLTARQDAVATLHGLPELRGEIRERLKKVADLERIAARLSAGRATPRDLVALKDSLRALPAFESALEGVKDAVLSGIRARFAGLAPVADGIESRLEDDCPNQVADGGLIRSGVNAELDRLRDVATGGKQWIASFQTEETKRTGIPSLKVGYNRVFGYYLEVTKPHLSRVPGDYERRQTLANAERFVTPALKEHEAEVLGAEEKTRALEAQLFNELRDQTARGVRAIQAAGAALAELDALASLAEVAAKRNYVRPEVTPSRRLAFQQLRHPVLEETLPKGQLVPNDLDVAAGGNDPGRTGTGATKVATTNARRNHGNGENVPQILLLTGPNMAGKSTYIRAAALAAILAQMGSFVPAEKAEVGLVDRIFTRVGAADDLYGGRSTFMVEMAEVAEILAHASDRSLVILDEVGRGTSTYDGVSLAWAIVEYLHDGRAKPRTLFATHYHELCGLEEELPRVRNASAVVKEWQGEITFLYRIVAGSSERSFGLHVAKLAGVPRGVIERARAILYELEAEAQERIQNVSPSAPAAAAGPAQRLRTRRLKPTGEDGQLLLFEPSAGEMDPRVKALLDELRALNPDALSPLEALAKLAELVKKARG